MDEEARRNLLDAAASSAMEGLALSPDDLETVAEIFSGTMTLNDYFRLLQIRTQEA